MTESSQTTDMGDLEHSTRVKSKSKKNIYILLSLLLYFVFIDELTDDFLLSSSSEIFKDESILTYLFLGLQIIFSTLQAGASDFFLRKKSLIFSILSTIIALLIFRSSLSLGSTFLIIAICLKGMLGNTLPIAWAGIADITSANNFRFALALSIFALAVGAWSILLIVPYLKISTLFLIVLSLVLIGFFFTFVFKDSKDADSSKSISVPRILVGEVKGLHHLLKIRINLMTFLSFFFSEMSFYQILFRVEVFHYYKCLILVPLAIGIGYTIGTVILKFLKLSDQIVSLIGIIISMISMCILITMHVLNIDNKITFTAFFAFYSLGYAFFTPALFSIITPRDHPHLQGKMFGLLESVDSFASLIVFIIIFNTSRLNCNYVFIMSTIMILIAGVFFYLVLRLVPKQTNKKYVS